MYHPSSGRPGKRAITAWGKTSESMSPRQKKYQINTNSRTSSSNWFKLNAQIPRPRTLFQSTRWICHLLSEAVTWLKNSWPTHMNCSKSVGVLLISKVMRMMLCMALIGADFLLTLMPSDLASKTIKYWKLYEDHDATFPHIHTPGWLPYLASKVWQKRCEARAGFKTFAGGKNTRVRTMGWWARDYWQAGGCLQCGSESARQNPWNNTFRGEFHQAGWNHRS